MHIYIIRNKIDIKLFFMKILGYEISEGKFNDRPYKNVNVYLQTSAIVVNGQGFRTLKQKIKYDSFLTFLSENHLDWDHCVGLSVNLYFNQYGNVEKIIIL